MRKLTSAVADFWHQAFYWENQGMGVADAVGSQGLGTCSSPLGRSHPEQTLELFPKS